MKEKEIARASIIKMVIVCIVMIFGLGIAVRAGNLKLNNIEIKLSDNSKISVVTSKLKVSEILEENHIIILPGEIVIPGLGEEITESKTIEVTIPKIEVVMAGTSNEEISTEMSQIFNSYVPIVEKIVVEQVEIPFETITKDISNGAEETTNRVMQNGVNGLKEVTYNVKYKNDIEFERIETSSVVIRQPVDKIVQVNVQAARGGRVATSNPAAESGSSIAARVKDTTPRIMSMNTSAYCACVSCCGKTNGMTASGNKASAWYTIAAGKGYPMGTVIYIPYFADKPNGGWFVVQDRGGAISNNKIDVFMDTHGQALQFGRRNLECYVYDI